MLQILILIHIMEIYRKLHIIMKIDYVIVNYIIYILYYLDFIQIYLKNVVHLVGIVMEKSI